MIYFTADLHLGHNNILKYANRPFETIEEMDGTIIDNINNTVKEDDTLFIVGDFSWKPKKYLDQLKCKVFLITGNHDRTIDVEKVFKEWDSFLIMKIGRFYCILNHLPNYYQKHFDFVICGHVHTAYKVLGRNVNVGVDQWSYKPVSYEELVLFLEGLGAKK